jgi:hypothetical protein
MNDCGAKSKLPAPLIYLSKTGNYSVSINGLGVFEGVFILLMSLGGVSAAEAVSIAVTGRLLETVSFLPWWLAYVIDDRTIRSPTPLQDHHPSG